MDPSTLVALSAATALVAVLALIAVLSRKTRTEDRARAYLAGFTYVLSDDPDAAIAELSRAAQLSTETLETYFALGALFRRKGDLERALRLHQNILLRPNLSAEIRRRAQLALALDYRRSGLRGKAAEVFESILQDDPGCREALLRYRQLCEDTGEWGRAVTCQSQLVKLDGSGQGILAHLLAAHARAAVHTEPSFAEALAEKAVALSPHSADAQLALAEVLCVRGATARARAPLEQAVGLEPEVAPAALPLLCAVLEDAEAIRLLSGCASQAGESGAPCGLALALWFRDRGQTEQAIIQLRRIVERRPWFWEARRELGALLLANDRSEELKADYQQILDTLGHAAMAFSCTACRQRLPAHAFRCPSCETWDTVRRDDARLPAASQTKNVA